MSHADRALTLLAASIGGKQHFSKWNYSSEPANQAASS